MTDDLFRHNHADPCELAQEARLTFLQGIGRCAEFILCRSARSPHDAGCCAMLRWNISPDFPAQSKMCARQLCWAPQNAKGAWLGRSMILH